MNVRWTWAMLAMLITVVLVSIPWRWCLQTARDPATLHRALKRASRFTVLQLLVTFTLLGASLGLVLRLMPPEAVLANLCLTLLFAMSFFAVVSLTWYTLANALHDTWVAAFVEKLRGPFSWRHLAVLGMGAAVVMVLVGAFVARDERFQALLMGGSIAVTLVALVLGAVGLVALALGGAADTVSYGRGSQRRINRLRELEDSQSIRLPRKVPRRKRKRISRE